MKKIINNKKEAIAFYVALSVVVLEVVFAYYLAIKIAGMFIE